MAVVIAWLIDSANIAALHKHSTTDPETQSKVGLQYTYAVHAGCFMATRFYASRNSLPCCLERLSSTCSVEVQFIRLAFPPVFVVVHLQGLMVG